MNQEIIYEIDDLVAVFGGEIGEEGKKADSVTICRVLVTGEEDLIVEDNFKNSYSRTSHYVVPKSICKKLSLDAEKLSSAKNKKPQIGDLVISYSQEPFGDKPPLKITGILYKIIYKLGKPKKSLIISGAELEEVEYSSLMVLQSNKKLI